MRGRALALWLALLLLATVCPAWADGADAPAAGSVQAVAPQEMQCMARGWKRIAMTVDGIPRVLLWKAPEGGWPKGAMVVLHGGGGTHFQWCVANAPLVASQVRFTDLAVADGFAVFLLNSTDRVSDNAGRQCGKVWDDELRSRSNLDLPFIKAVMRDILPRLRPVGSRTELFLTGLSSGGYMATRAATHFGDRVTAFAPVSSGDPYGWHRLCVAGLTMRRTVHGVGVDNETGKRISEPDACKAAAYPNERPWDGARQPAKAAFRVFRHEEDGINDQSCSQKASQLLRQHGYRGEPDFVLTGGRRGLENHLWLDAYSRPVLDFFAGQLGGAGR